MTSRRAQIGTSAATAAAMLATPFFPAGGLTRRVLASPIVGGLFATAACGGSRRWGPKRIGVALLGTSLATAVVEVIGVRTGRPFGRYRYTEALRPQVAAVPVIVPIAWAAMAVPARETAHAALGDRSSRATRVVVGAAALTAWDLFLDPQMVGEGYWRWLTAGRYRGIPLTNYAGWFATGLVVMALLEVTLPPLEPAPDLVAQYAAMGAMETVAFATFLRDGRVALIGAAAMLPVAAVGVARLVGQRR